MRSVLKSSLAVVGAAALAVPALAPASAQGDNPNNGGRKVSAALTGAVEIPPGDPNVAGLFEARINPGT